MVKRRLEGKERHRSPGREEHPPEYTLYHTPPTWGWTAGAVFVALVFAVITLATLWLFGRIISLFILGIAIAAALAPLVRRAEKHIPRSLAVVLVFFFILVIFGGIISITLPAMIQQGEEIAQLLPQFIDLVEDWYERWGADLPLVEIFFEQIVQLATALVGVPLGLLSAVVEIVLVLFSALYLLLESPRLRRFTLSLFPPERQQKVDDVTEEMFQAMGGFVRGAVITAILVGIFTYFGLLIIGVRFPLVLALIAAVFELLPYIGPFLAAIPMLVVALMDSPTQALLVLVFFVILQQLESYVLVPNIMKSQTEISPLMALLAIVAGGSLGGLLGALVAIPLTSSLLVLVKRVVAPEIRKRTGAVREYIKPEEEEADGEENNEEEIDNLHKKG
jgi:predicted PurR-regulated permease PerM